MRHCKNKKMKGLAFIEYTLMIVGVLSVVYIGIQAYGNAATGLVNNVTAWVNNRAAEIPQN